MKARRVGGGEEERGRRGIVSRKLTYGFSL